MTRTPADVIHLAAMRAGLVVGPRLPVAVQRGLVSGLARVAPAVGGPALRRYAENVTLATGRPASAADVRAGVASYLRTYLEVLALGRWSAERVRGTVRVDGEDRLREAFAERGAVIALPHSGNWDLAGAWACASGLPVTTVAEQLADAEFATFLRIRERLGMQVHAHTEPGLVASLSSAARSGRVVCLMADRDFTGGAGVEARWGTRTVRVPAGPAMIARRSGAALFAGVCHYTGQVGTGGMVITLSPEIDHRPGRDGLIAMTQQVVDHFADRIGRHPADWHLFQPFFPPDDPEDPDDPDDRDEDGTVAPS